MERLTLHCKNVISDDRTLELVYSKDSFSFVGGVNTKTGEITDYRHANYKENIKGKAFAFPFGRGSSGAGLVLMEMARLGTAPGAIINIHTDPVILTGPLICEHYYGQIIPVINLTEEDYAKLAGAKTVTIHKEEEKIEIC